MPITTADQSTALTDTEILDCFMQTVDSSNWHNHLVAVGRAIEAKLREKLPKSDLLRAAQYIGSEEGDSIDTEEGNRIAQVLRELAE